MDKTDLNIVLAMLTKDNELYTILRNTENEVEIKEVILIVNAFILGKFACVLMAII